MWQKLSTILKTAQNIAVQFTKWLAASFILARDTLQKAVRWFISKTSAQPPKEKPVQYLGGKPDGEETKPVAERRTRRKAVSKARSGADGQGARKVQPRDRKQSKGAGSKPKNES